MKGKKGLIFSLDAFVSFSLLLIALNCLVLIYSRPPTYLAYYVYVRNLELDLLRSFLSINASSMGIGGQYYASRPLLFYIVDKQDPAIIKTYFDPLIPKQFGYAIEFNTGSGWQSIYTSLDDPTSFRPKEAKIFNVSTSMAFNVFESEDGTKVPYGYVTCDGKGTLCDFPISLYKPPRIKLYRVRLVMFR